MRKSEGNYLNIKFTRWDNFCYWSCWTVVLGIVFWIGYEIIKHY